MRESPASRWRVRVLQALLPAPCLLCGESAAGAPLCAECLAALPWNTCACPRCAVSLEHAAPSCGRCLRRPPAFSACFAPLRYQAPVDRLLTDFKFGQRLAAGATLSGLIATAPALDRFLDGIDAALPVPLAHRRLRERGYNQALELLRPLAKARRLPVLASALVRTRDTAAQTGLDARARRRNLKGAFAAVRAQVEGRRLLLVDDVVTTGTTADEAARTLLGAGAVEVRVLAAARA